MAYGLTGLRISRRAAAAWCAGAACLSRAQTPLNFDARQAHEVVALLAQAPTHGLDPSDYGLLDLAQRVQALSDASDAALNQALAAAMLHYLRDVHEGRVRPSQLEHHFATEGAPRFDAESSLRAALALQDLALAVDQAAPALPQYAQLREALGRYRALLPHEAWAAPLPALPRGRSVRPGESWAGVGLLSERLHALGDAAHASIRDATLYDGPIVEAVTSFQERHGLRADGVIGRATWAALEVPLMRRVRQIELTLERLRWTPLRQAARMVVINVPEFVLRAYEVRGERIAVREEMKVIVGQALDTRTPLINEAMRRIEFQPFWNVPASIARKELVPRLRRDPSYWDKEGFEFIGAAGVVQTRLSASELQSVLDGRLRIRQRPGPHNALGGIKFVFPNRESIYLHHTPMVSLFERSRRDFSHGCIRVERPVALARFALDGQPEWTEQRILDAMRQDKPSAVALARPLPVLIAYGTALVKRGRVHFFEDLYGHDRALETALQRRALPSP